MATLSTTNLKESVKRAINKIKNKRADHSNEANGVFFITGTKAVVAADYDVVGDIIELCQLPANSYLLGASVISDKDYDTGGTAVRHDLIVTEGTSFTSGAGVAFANAPANEKVEMVSDAAGDTTQKITIVGITTGTDTLVAEEMALNGATQVDSVKADWGVILAAWVSSGTLAAGSTVTLREASGNATITTLTPENPTSGVETPTSTNFQSRLVEIVCSGTGTKQIGLYGTDPAGNAQYDSQALSGVTVQYSNLPFATVTKVFTGDLEATRTVTVRPGSLLLASASAAFSTTPTTPINYTGATAYGTEFGCDVSEGKLALRCNVAPTTANTGTVTFTYKVAVYYGNVSSVGVG